MNNHNKPNSNTLVAVQRSVTYSAPLPEASQFEAYERAVPGAGDRILAMAEKQSLHRQNVERISIVGDQARGIFGLFCGLIVAIVGLGGSIFLAIKGKELASGFLGTGTLCGF